MKVIPRGLGGLVLKNNKIGREGCKAVLMWLRNQDNFLDKVDLGRNPGFESIKDLVQHAMREKTAFLGFKEKKNYLDDNDNWIQFLHPADLEHNSLNNLDNNSRKDIEPTSSKNCFVMESKE